MGEHQHARASVTPEIEEEILLRISDGEPLLVICGPKRREGMPNRNTIHKHLRDNAAFRRAYLTARDAQAASIAEDAMMIADGLRAEGNQPPCVARDRLRVSTRQWLVGVMAPRIYAQKMDELAAHHARMKLSTARE